MRSVQFSGQPFAFTAKNTRATQVYNPPLHPMDEWVLETVHEQDEVAKHLSQPGWKSRLSEGVSWLKNRLSNFLFYTRPESKQNALPVRPLFYPEPPAAGLKSHSFRSKANFPAGQTQARPIPGEFQCEEGMMFFDEHLHLHEFFQFGNLARHGAFWLEDEQGKLMGLTRRERTAYTLGEKQPRPFHKLEITLTDAAKQSPVYKNLHSTLLEEATRQARHDGIRLMLPVANPEEQAFYRSHGFVSLQHALNQYVPKGQSNPAQKDTLGWMAFDGQDPAREPAFSARTRSNRP